MLASTIGRAAPAAARAPMSSRVAPVAVRRGRGLVARCFASAAEVKIAIEGMMCDGCSGRIEKVLKGMDTVKSVHVNLEGKSATVELTKGDAASPEAKAAAAALVDTINSLGFEAKLAQ
ncbi:hypothetical protein HYH02_008984 [Chlamydomonas schloesseri]|uniref:HMA domain-containing protein n=1 Tax=Chlamydomonas schloesseri TaxID=2026947 RepID=A0A836B1Z0_9CHLO|nr:hypothetical protein HYH02_008984 [Chlamydomonas schloesseri]|eukprot:KAG2445117.1 hypothetical protein HYH02_008984 [Chlamydomonas schloesseri]